MESQPDLVTGDAVVLELPTATIGSRGAALALDIMIELTIFFVGLLLFSVSLSDYGSDGITWLTIAVLPMLIISRVVYPVLMETFGGRTLGKMALGIRVVRQDGGPIRFRHALARGLTGAIVDFGPAYLWGIIGLAVSLSSTKSQRIGDYLAGTLVIRDRAPSVRPVNIELPVGLEDWAAHLDLSHVDDQLALALRQFLNRQHQMRTEARNALGTSLVREALGTAEALPENVEPRLLVSAILAERRRRAAP